MTDDPFFIQVPYQTELAETIATADVPLRLVLSAPPGYGKTTAIAATLKAISDSHGQIRFLIVTPAALQASWNGILGRFGLDSRIVDAPAYRVLQASAPALRSPWDQLSGVVVSIDFLKREERLAEVLQVPWDVVVLDEAHIYTATSQRGRIAMALWTNVGIAKAVAACAVVNPVRWLLDAPGATLVRWDPKTLRGRAGVPPLMEREIQTVFFEPSAEEKAFGQFLIAAVERIQANSTAARFFGELLMRRAGSSLYAIEQSLRRYASSSVIGAKMDFDEPDEWYAAESESERPVTDLLSSGVLEEALRLLEDVPHDSKYRACADLVKRLEANGRSVVIFTDFADTADYLGEQFCESGWPTWVVTGKLRMEERYHLIDQARAQRGVLILTSEVTEGISLKFTNQAIHYDLPLSASLLLQRFGRLERIGSEFQRAFHYFLSDGITIPERLLAKLQMGASEIEDGE